MAPYGGRPPHDHTQRADRWVFKKELGNQNGGMNSGICIVADYRTGKAFIEKRIERQFISNGYAWREIQTLKQLRGHAHIVSIEDYFIDSAKMVGSIFMEYCSLGSLDRLIERHEGAGYRPIGEHLIWNFSIHIADALAFCHYGPNPHDIEKRTRWNTVFHRDIKPGNILLAISKEGPLQGQVIAKLADFGCASSADLIVSEMSNPRKQSAGTRQFRQPEYPEFKQQSDVWQLGIVIQCLCKLWHTPRDYDSVRPIGRPYSDQLDYVVRQCLEPQWDKRWTSMNLLSGLKGTYKRILRTLPPDIEPILPKKV